MNFAGKRVAVIGTGATGVQTIQEVAKTAGTLTRVPAHAQLVRAAAQRGRSPRRRWPRSGRGYPEIFQRCQETFACFLHTPDPRKHLGGHAEEREALWEKLYGEPGFGMWQGNFRDILDRPQGQRAGSATSSPARSASG